MFAKVFDEIAKALVARFILEVKGEEENITSAATTSKDCGQAPTWGIHSFVAFKGCQEFELLFVIIFDIEGPRWG